MPELFKSKHRIKKEARYQGTKGKEILYDQNKEEFAKPKEQVYLENLKRKRLRNVYNGGWRGQAIYLRKAPSLESRIRKKIFTHGNTQPVPTLPVQSVSTRQSASNQQTEAPAQMSPEIAASQQTTQDWVLSL